MKLLFCHVPKSGGYSFLNWFRNDLDIYAYNDNERLKSFDEQLKRFNQADIVEIHGGNPYTSQLKELVDSSGAICIYLSIIRNPVTSYESLFRDAYVSAAYIDLPIVPTSFEKNTVDIIYKDVYANYKFDICKLFDLYAQYWIDLDCINQIADNSTQVLCSLLSIKQFQECTHNAPQHRYLFKRNSQSIYINAVFGSDFLHAVFNGSSHAYLMTTEHLDSQFIQLIKSDRYIKEFSIFHNYADNCPEADMYAKLLSRRKNVTPSLPCDVVYNLDAHRAYRLMYFNELDYYLWFAVNSRWNK